MNNYPKEDTKKSNEKKKKKGEMARKTIFLLPEIKKGKDK